MKKIVLILILFFAGFGVVLNAQSDLNIPVPYSFGFEDSEQEELSKWVLNPGVLGDSLSEKWIVGTAAHSEGKKGLYVSCDGENDLFGAAVLTQYAYRDFLLPKGTYECSFDWRCIGANNASLFAGVYDQQTIANSMVASGTTNGLPGNILNGCTADNRNLRGTIRWQHSSFRISSNGNRVIRMYFVWATANQDTTLTMPVSACIDNIQITLADCKKPSFLEVELNGDSLVANWSGTSEQYVFEYRRYGRDKWNVTSGIYKDSYVIEGLDEGAYDFRVRGVCNQTDSSAYTYKNSFLIYYPDKHCIDFVHLGDNPNIDAEYGKFSVNNTTHVVTTNYEIGVVDNGPDNMLSRHTVNLEPDTYDPRTNYKLSTIAPNGLASVRLGNWQSGNGTERLTFTYTVDESSAILLMHYAIVLQDPNHSEWQQPRFTLEILDPWDELISPTCGYADFYADIDREDWHAVGSSITWKDWTTIGLNLSDRIGQTIRVRVTTYDCSLGGHWGYAYFSLDCAAAKISGTSCGDDAQLSIAAPDGFAYQWYDKYEKEVPESRLTNNGQTLLVDASDTTTYRCHLSYLEEPSCGFDLYSAALPRFPIASFDWSYEPAECQNRVRFINKSHIMTKFDGNIEYHYDQSCDEYEWSYGNGQVGSDRNPVVIFPQSGGTFDVTLFASIAEGRCVDDTIITVTIPEIGDKEITIDTAICDGSYIKFGEQYAGIERQYVNVWETTLGCDSTVYLNLSVNPQTEEYQGDTVICAEVPLTIDGQTYKLHESGKFYRFYTNVYGCDSTLWMNVTMKDSILPIVDVTDVTTLGSGEIILGGTGYDYYEVNGELNGKLTGLDGGIFNIEFFNDLGCSIDTTVIMNYDCLSVHETDRDFVCVDDDVLQIRYIKDLGISTQYSLVFSEEALAVGFSDVTESMNYVPDGMQFAIDIDIESVSIPGLYSAELILTDPLCENVHIPLTLQINFSSDIVFQRWGDVLSVKKLESIGDYGFLGFQWLRNGEKIEGATKSYYYADGGLDLNAEYQVELLMSDSTVLTTCVLSPEEYTGNIEVQPTQVRALHQIQVKMPEEGIARCYSPTGLILSTTTLNVGRNYLTAPAQRGVYLVNIETKDGVKTVLISVVD